MFQRFTDRARRAVVLSQEEARLLNHDYIGTEHLLLGLVHEADGIAGRALDNLGVGLEPVRQWVTEIVGRGERAPSGHVPFTARAKTAFELALREAMRLGHNYIGTEHILLGLLRGDGVAVQVLRDLGADLDKVRDSVTELVSSAEDTEQPTAISDELTGGISAPAHSFPGRMVGQINPRWPGPRHLALLILMLTGAFAGDSGSSLYSAGAAAAIVAVVVAALKALPWPWRHDDRWVLVIRVLMVLALGSAAVLFFASAI